MKETKLFKRLACLFLTAIMIMGMSIPVLAKDIIATKSVSLTINKYKVDNATVWDTLDKGTGLPVDPGTLAGSGATPLPGVTYTITLMELSTPDADPSKTENYDVSRDPEVTLTGVTNGSGQIVFDDEAYQAEYNTTERLPQGVYKVEETLTDVMDAQSQEFYVSLPMTDPTENDEWLYEVNVYPKNKITEETVDLEKKVQLDDESWADEKNVETGETVKWQIRSTIPDNIKNAQSYEITDAYDSRLTLAENTISVYYNDSNTDKVTLDEVDDSSSSGLTDTTGDYWITDGINEFTVHLTQTGMAKLDDAASAEKNLYVEFDTTVAISDHIDIGEIVNNAKLEYVNQFGEKSEPADSARVWSGGMLVTKVDGKNATALEGVEFQLYYKDDSSVKHYYGGLDGANKIIWTTEDRAKTLKTDASGKFEILGLEDGTYWLTEIKTLAGYNLLDKDVEVTIARTDSQERDSNDEIMYSYAEAELLIKNYQGFTLPLTGGAGALWITVIGLALIAAAGIIVIRSKKKKAEKNINV